MENLPFYISGGFIATTLLTIFLLYRASRYNKTILIFSIAWLLLQGGLTLTGFYLVLGGVPPRFSLLLIPPVLLIAGLFATKRGRVFFDDFDARQLTLLHIVRLPVELILWALYLYHFVPGRMTFEGGNLDILSGLSAPLIFYFGYIKRTIQRKWLLIWNIACLLLLINIVSRAVLSFGQPDLALFYFPYSWLPGFVVPAVLLAHLITIRRLVKKNRLAIHFLLYLNMEPQFEQIREQQKQSWNKFSPGWKKWDDLNMAFLRPMGDAIISNLLIRDGDLILDIAAGTGEPGLTMAGLTPNGKVTGTDLAEAMLAIAAENAQSKGLTNYETVVADAGELPFGTESFNGVSCRMGFMFFPDMQLAADEMYRVLKPGGRIATAVWASPELNNWVTTIMSVIRKHIELPAPLPAAPGMFRCATPGLIAGLFKQAGFKDVRETVITGQVDYQSFDRYWTMMLEVGAPIVAALAGADEATEATIKAETAELFHSKNKGDEAILDYAALIIFGKK